MTDEQNKKESMVTDQPSAMWLYAMIRNTINIKKLDRDMWDCFNMEETVRGCAILYNHLRPEAQFDFIEEMEAIK